MYLLLLLIKPIILRSPA